MRQIPILVAIAIASLSSAGAYWNPDPAVNVPISLADGEKYDVFAVSDGVGGALLVWEDKRSGDSDIYMQRLNVRGETLWQVGGVPVCTALNDQFLYHSATGTTGFTPLVPDGQGGAFVAWQDARFFSARQNDIYCQRIDADGQILFPPDGLPVATGPGMEDQPTLCPDGDGGVFAVWQDKNSDPIFYDLWGQHISATGELLWNGGAPLPLVEVAWDQDAPTLCPDGQGGFFMAWTDSRTHLNDIYAQRIDADGQPLWAANGVPVYEHTEGLDAVVIEPAADGNPVLAWVDRRSGSPDIYAQKLSAEDGGRLWDPSGIPACNAPQAQYRPALASDGAGGAFLAWFDYRNAPSGPPWNLDIYAVRLLTDGTLAPGWPPNGLAVCSAADAQRDVDICGDFEGGIFLAWEDNRAGAGHEDIYAQHVDASGTMLWETDGRAVSTATYNQQRPDLIPGAGGVVLAWRDDRDLIYQPDIYADRVLAYDEGVLGLSHVGIHFGEVSGMEQEAAQVSNVGAVLFEIEAVSLARGDQGFDVIPAAEPPVPLAPQELLALIVSFDPALAPFGETPLRDTLFVYHAAPRLAGQSEAPSPIGIPLSAAATAMHVVTPWPTSSRAPRWLLESHPNPAHHAARITLVRAPSLAPLDERGPAAAGHDGGSHGTLDVLDPSGRIVRQVYAGPAADRLTLTWDGRDEQGHPAGPGLYLLRWVSGGESAVHRVLRTR